ncbi:NUDIX domain-containing protein [Arenibaculum pallidiluteum]|uniref:NUDIX domain-containing protein n=1 Tax=Arenibaculum pallidiluteum TaxID=2812559 RepID=UPI001A95D138|nr:NUDIX domain-containing protein [Arenibaculum pallidiluteum]
MAAARKAGAGHPALGRALRALHLTRLGWRWLAGPVTLGVRVVVPDGTGRVLLVRHSYVAGWHLPGGGVSRGESLRAAALRELAEECGVQASAARLLGIYLRLRLGRRHSDHVAVYVAEDWRGEPRSDGREILEAAFFHADALPPDTTPATRRRIAEWRGAPPQEHW